MEKKYVQKNDPVNHPAHYTKGKVECIDAIEAAVSDLNGMEAFLTGQVIKYSYRYKDKGGSEDLRKAEWYLRRLIRIVETREEKEESQIPAPCPKCGFKYITFVRNSMNGEPGRMMCAKCLKLGPLGISREEAVRLWNEKAREK